MGTHWPQILCSRIPWDTNEAHPWSPSCPGCSAWKCFEGAKDVGPRQVHKRWPSDGNQPAIQYYNQNRLSCLSCSTVQASSAWFLSKLAVFGEQSRSCWFHVLILIYFFLIPEGFTIFGDPQLPKLPSLLGQTRCPVCSSGRHGLRLGYANTFSTELVKFREQATYRSTQCAMLHSHTLIVYRSIVSL